MKKKIFSITSLLLMNLMVVGCSSNHTRAAITIDLIGDKHTTEYFNYEFNIEKYASLEDKPDIEKAKVGLLFAANISTGSAPVFEELNEKPEELDLLDYERLHKHFGLDDYVAKKCLSDDTYDLFDISLLTMAHKKVVVNEKTYDIGFITPIDSGGDIQWYSNFDIGANNDSYLSMTGEHPDWVDHSAHKGFDIASTRCLREMENYISTKMDKDAEKVFYIFGHSRGGAVGNLLAKKAIDKGYNLTAYLYAGPAPTTAKDINDAKYAKIFNFINKSDLIDMILPEKWGFGRYGTTTIFDMGDYPEKFKEVNHVSMPSGNPKLIIDGIFKMADSREAIYDFQDRYILTTSSPLDSEQMCNDYANNFLAKLKKDYQEVLIYTKKEITPTNDGKYIVKVRACPGFILGLIGIVVAKHSFSGITTLMDYGQYTKPFVDAFEFTTSQIVYIGSMMNYIIFNHYFYSYVAYFLL